MTQSLEFLYLKWLYSQIQWNEGDYWDLLKIMFEKEFVWFVSNDDNRLADGLDIRAEFLHSLGNPSEGRELAEKGCSAVEVLLGLSRRLSFATEESSEYWAWELIRNLKLHKYEDPLKGRKQSRVYEILDRLVWRRYDPDGTGGFFPLAWPKEDQTKVELWYQMSAYLEELVQH